MQTTNAISVLMSWNRRHGRSVFTREDLRKLFPDDTDLAFKESLPRLIGAGVLSRISKGVFLFSLAQRPTHLLEETAATLRRGHYSYLSLESALSEYGAISQIPLAGITVMTRGRSGLFETPYGRIEFTHTKRPAADILRQTTDVGRPLRIATPEAAMRDLRRVGRNLHLVDEDALLEAMEDE